MTETPSLEQDSIRNPDGTLKQGAVYNEL